MAEMIGAEQRKIGPRLRQIMSDGLIANTLRAEQAPEVAIRGKEFLSQMPNLQALSRGEAKPRALSEWDELAAVRGEAGTELVSAFIELDNDRYRVPKKIKEVVEVTGRMQNLLTVTVPKHELATLAQQEAVLSIEPGERIVFSPPLDVRAAEPPAPSVRSLDDDLQAQDEGPGVLIGIVDVGGFDFTHPDFLDDKGKTRFYRIWDQGGSTRPSPKGYDYGAEITEEQMNAAMAAAPDYGIPAHRLEPQSQMVEGSHATHVASIAAGNRGVCCRVRIAGVLISFPTEGGDPRQQFYDSTRIAHAVDYLFALGERLGLPVSINISLGTNGHAHDACSPISRWIDRALTTPGRSVCVAAGNAGQEAPLEPGDQGFVMGRIHTSGTIPATGLTRDIEWVVGGDGIVDVSDNELVFWYGPQDRFAVRIRPPGSTQWTDWVHPGNYLELPGGPDQAEIRIYNDLYVPANGHNRITCQLSPYWGGQQVQGIPSGTWLVRLYGESIRDGAYHGWIERDDPRRIGALSSAQQWSFPSFFSRQSNVDDSSISSLACGHRVVAVANLDEHEERIHITSSQGPTRDSRQKPEITAPGTEIVAAAGFSLDPDRQWITMTGTSMASPYVAGVVGRMLSIAPRLTADQISGILRRTALPLPGADYRWQNDAGFGRIDPAACIREAAWLGNQ